MGLASLVKPTASTVTGLDCSTKSLAWATFTDGKPISCGEITFTGTTIFERLQDARLKVRALLDLGIISGDYIVIEAAIMAKSANTAIDLAYIYGAVISEVGSNGQPVEKVYPITWQSFIGVPNLTKAEREDIKSKTPDRKPSWYQNEGRKIRKARIMDWASQYFTLNDHFTDNVTDAIGIAYYVSQKMVA